VNLGWKLAQVHGSPPKSLLDTYQAERHPIGARVLNRGDERRTTLREAMIAVYGTDFPDHVRRCSAIGGALQIEDSQGSCPISRQRGEEPSARRISTANGLFICSNSEVAPPTDVRPTILNPSPT
jgi:hypothetical protein